MDSSSFEDDRRNPVNEGNLVLLARIQQESTESETRHSPDRPSSTKTERPAMGSTLRRRSSAIRHRLIAFGILTTILGTSRCHPTIDIREGSNLPQNATEGILELDTQPSAGESCPGSEGQWYCMTNRWQRCASGKWSVVMQCAAGTICTPVGMTYDFHVQASNTAVFTGGVSVGARRHVTVAMRLLWAMAFCWILWLLL
jgi:hypothetical protein